MDELTRPAAIGRDAHDPLELPLEPAASRSAGDVGQLGEALRGDETAARSGFAAGESVSPDGYNVPPSQRRFGEGVVSDSPNFQGRPNTSLSSEGDATSADGGSGR